MYVAVSWDIHIALVRGWCDRRLVGGKWIGRTGDFEGCRVAIGVVGSIGWPFSQRYKRMASIKEDHSNQNSHGL